MKIAPYLCSENSVLGALLRLFSDDFLPKGVVGWKNASKRQ